MELLALMQKPLLILKKKKNIKIVVYLFFQPMMEQNNIKTAIENNIINLREING